MMLIGAGVCSGRAAASAPRPSILLHVGGATVKNPCA
ncbi:MAG: hypothetical protein FD129_829, partial [bacterium]